MKNIQIRITKMYNKVEELAIIQKKIKKFYKIKGIRKFNHIKRIIIIKINKKIKKFKLIYPNIRIKKIKQIK